MKTHRNFCIFLALALVAWLSAGCDDTPSNPTAVQTVERGNINNVVWSLASYGLFGFEHNLTGYPPFRLVFADDRFFGDDGCNFYGANYEARNDSIIPRDFAQGLALCIVRTFPTGHLTRSYRLQIGDDRLRIFTRDAVYTYRSDYRESVENSLLLRNWLLIGSTDPGFAQIQAQQLTPMLSLDEDREFKLAWYCATENDFGCDEISGLFGVGEDDKFLFYAVEWQHHHPGTEFMLEILRSSSYSVKQDTVKAATLVLVNDEQGTRFEFAAIVR